MRARFFTICLIMTATIGATAGAAAKMMERILVNHTPWEIGYRPSEELVSEGGRLFEPKP